MTEIQNYIERFIASASTKDIRPDSILIDIFGDSPDLTDQLLELVLAGTKTATCLSLYEWEHEVKTPLVPGTLSVILNGLGQPRCVIETTHVEQMPYQEVTAEFARAEGEHEPPDLPDDRVLQHWRDVHWAYFNRKLPPLGHIPTLDMPVLCERFRVIYTDHASHETHNE
ncbi:MAG: ASCH domain-containing protein [Phycisphaerales bacterium]|nr:ASCH domain-containing protein [Phycisphaerales bacterium]